VAPLPLGPLDQPNENIESGHIDMNKKKKEKFDT
jgi:hypothetical protein